nr:hypothetical protein [Tanacetum cinerariifolium]
MVTKHNQKLAAEKEGKKNPRTAKQPKPKPTKEKSSKPAHAPKPKLVDEPNEEPAQHDPEPDFKYEGEGEDQDVEQAIQMSLESFQAHVGGVAIREPLAEASRPLLMVKGKGKAIATYEQVAQSLLALHAPKRRNTTDQFIFQRRTSATDETLTRPSAHPQDDTFTNIVRDSLSPDDAKTGADTNRQIVEVILRYYRLVKTKEKM